MAEGETGYKWWIRYVVVPLVGGGGIVTLVIALMNRPIQSVPPPPIPTEQVRKVAAQWLDDVLSGRADEAIALSDTRVYLDGSIVSARDDLKALYLKIASDRAHVVIGKVQTLADYERAERDPLLRDATLQQLNLSPADFAVKASDAKDDVIILIRRIDERQFLVAGLVPPVAVREKLAALHDGPTRAKDIATRWMNALLSGAVDNAVALTDLEGRTTADVKERLNEFVAHGPNAQGQVTKIGRVTVETLAARRARTGQDLESEKGFRELNLAPTDYVVMLSLESAQGSKEALVLVRQTGNAFKVAGMH